MPKTTIPYWNPLAQESDQSWKPVEGMEGIAEAITLSIDEETGDYSRITRFLPGADTTALGPQVHDYPEEVLIMDGIRLPADSSAIKRAKRSQRSTPRLALAPSPKGQASRRKLQVSRGIGHTSCLLAQRPSLGVMLNP
jgi:hypothetical protein